MRGLGARANRVRICDYATCTGDAPQQVTFASSGELSLLGGCVTGGGGAAVLEPCKGTANQHWWLP